MKIGLEKPDFTKEASSECEDERAKEIQRSGIFIREESYSELYLQKVQLPPGRSLLMASEMVLWFE
jgi:hypothetical protein